MYFTQPKSKELLPLATTGEIFMSIVLTNELYGGIVIGIGALLQ
jgi:hypothetical protein